MSKGKLYTLPTITTDYDPPAHHDRSHDWVAYFDGEAEAGNCGYGPTEADAIHDFLINCAGEHLERMGIIPPL